MFDVFSFYISSPFTMIFVNAVIKWYRYTRPLTITEYTPQSAISEHVPEVFLFTHCDADDFN
jgi:hypothetical protein